MSDKLQDLILDVREQVLYLQELGVESFDVKLKENIGRVELRAVDPVPGNPAKEIVSNLMPEVVKPLEPRLTGSRLSSLPSLSNRAARTSQPVDREAETPRLPELSETHLIDIKPTLLEPVETIEQIRAEIGPDCTRCPLHALGRSKVVNSVGNFNADLMFVGEAPGADEDEQGEPFVGRAGQLLTKIIEGIGLRREDVFIGNINRCRPPGNRAPEPIESATCKPFLLREIATVGPKVIVVLGATAAQNLLETKVPIGKLRGHFHDYLGVKVMPTFHPAYLLRDPHKKREVWDDMKLVRDYLKSMQ